MKLVNNLHTIPLKMCYNKPAIHVKMCLPDRTVIQHRTKVAKDDHNKNITHDNTGILLQM
jgi:hypothetical protein